MDTKRTTPDISPAARAARVRRWVEELRSGRWQQGRNVLKDLPYGPAYTPHYCCLGVACELFKQEVGLKWDTDTPSAIGRVSPPTLCGGSDPTIGLLLPWQIRELLFGVKDMSLNVLLEETPPENQFELKLAQLNDRGVSFDDIADYIEQNYPFLLPEGSNG